MTQKNPNQNEDSQLSGDKNSHHLDSFIKKVESLGWNFVKEAKTSEFEISGWLEDNMGNEIYLLKVRNSPELRLSVFINTDSTQIDKDLLIKITNICWLDGLNCKFDKVEGKDVYTILIGTTISEKNLNKKTLWRSVNILIFCEYMIRKILPLRSVKEILDTSSRLNTIFRDKIKFPKVKKEGFEAYQEFEPVFQTLHFLMCQPVESNEVFSICSRFQEHRECCWLIPRNSEVMDDFIKFSKNISSITPQNSAFEKLDDLNLKNQIVRIIGDWNEEWNFWKVSFKDDSDTTFVLYKIESQNKTHWFIQNRLACNSLWLMNDDLLKEFTELSKKICAYI